MVNINRWKVGKRLTFGFGLMLLLGVCMTLLQVWGTESVIASQKTIYEDRTQPLHDLSETPRTAFGDAGRPLSGAALVRVVNFASVFCSSNQNPTQVTAAIPPSRHQSVLNPQRAITWVPRSGAMMLASEYAMVYRAM